MTGFWKSVASTLCPFTTSTFLDTADSIFVSVVCFLLITGFLANAFLLFTIIMKSPPTLTPYRIFLANTTLTLFTLSVVGYLSQPRILTKGDFVIIIYLGPVQFFGEWFSYMSYIGILHLSQNVSISLMLSMMYRYGSLRFRKFSVNRSILMCCIGYIPPFLMFASCSNIVVSSELGVNKMILNDMIEHLESYRMPIASNVKSELPVTILIMGMTFGLAAVYLVMYWCRHQIYKTLKITRSVHSAATKENAKRLVHALTIQSMVPLISVFPATTFYCLSQLGLVESSTYSYFSMPCLSLACVFDPIITLRFVLPYRRFFMKTFFCRTAELVVLTKSEVMSKSTRNVFY